MAVQAVTATKFQNNFGKFLQFVQEGNEVVIFKNGKEVARLISKQTSRQFLVDSLAGILKNDTDEKKITEERVRAHEDPDRH